MKTKTSLAILALMLVTMAHAQSKPQTNGERGMLKYNEAFGSDPKIRLCAFIAYKPNDQFPKDTIFLSACDFKANWAKKH